jgi:hypothetical protein
MRVSDKMTGDRRTFPRWPGVDKGLVYQIHPQIPLCKKKISITLKCRHIYGVLNIDEIKN